MAEPDAGAIVTALLDRNDGMSFVEQAGISLKESPNTVFQVLELGVLQDARVHPGVGVEAFLRIEDRKWTTAKGMVETDHRDVVSLLTELRYPESDADRIATALRDSALHLLADHGGDPEGIRRVVDADPDRERAELTRFVGVRDAAVDGFFREIQLLWDELHPFAGKAALDTSARLGLGDDVSALRRQVDSSEDFVRLTDALLRARHDENGLEEVEKAAGGT